VIRLLPNLGGEEGSGWRAFVGEPSVRTQASLWRWLFPPDAELLYGQDEAASWPDGLGPAPAGPAFPWLAAEHDDLVVPWIVTADAAHDRRVAGRPLLGPHPDCVRAVHDKAFAHAVAARSGLVPEILSDCIAVLSPEELRSPDAPERIETRLADGPAWARERFTLKPRLGSSGRGRVAGRAGRLERAVLGSALLRLSERGGAMLEPWLDRLADLSVQLHVGADGVTLLGSLEQELAPSGRFLGHRGEIDSRGRVFSGHPEEEPLREAAALVASAARERGYFGPCGIDAFTFRDPESGRTQLRPVVEHNARFTAGTVTVGLLRRLLAQLKKATGLGPGERLYFRFRLHDVEVAEHDVEVAEHDVEVAEHDVEVAEHDVEVAEHDVEVAEHDVEVAEHDVEVAEHDVEVAEHDVEVAEHDVEVAEGDVGTSEVWGDGALRIALAGGASLAFSRARPDALQVGASLGDPPEP
jgi:hypothetical protein